MGFHKPLYNKALCYFLGVSLVAIGGKNPLDSHDSSSLKRIIHKNYRILRGGPRGGGNWGTLRIPRGRLGNLREY